MTHADLESRLRNLIETHDPDSAAKRLLLEAADAIRDLKLQLRAALKLRKEETEQLGRELDAARARWAGAEGGKT